MNGLLTPLAIVGIAMFGVALVFVAIYFVQQIRDVVRIVRSARVEVKFSGDEAPTPVESPAPPPPPEPELPQETRRGWGFDL
jgi:hypothetical protein